MNEYRRFVSYIYAYPGGTKEKNVGFSKVEVRQGQFKLSVTLRGVYTDTPELFTVYMLVDRDKTTQGKYTLVPLGNCMVKNGMSLYNDIFNAGNINMTGYEFADICGIAVANANNRYYMMFTMWEDYDVNPSMVVIADRNHKKTEDKQEVKEPEAEAGVKNKAEFEAQYEAGHDKESEEQSAVKNEAEFEAQSGVEFEAETVADAETGNQVKPEAEAEERKVEIYVDENSRTTGANVENAAKDKQLEDVAIKSEANKDIVRAAENKNSELEPEEQTGIERMFAQSDSIDAFPDDVYYDCIEISPEMLRNVLLPDEISPNNSFLLHGYYNFRHLLFGRVQENANNTKYFLGVPGMYCNRERYMASMFGFRNFKKSHRSDYLNPYFGYWIMEM